VILFLPGVVQLYEAFSTRSTLYLVMEFLPNGSLAGLLRRQKLLNANGSPHFSEDDARRIMAPVVQVSSIINHEKKTL
jgi:serine/threonine protein kinase